MAGSRSRQAWENSAFWLATWAGKMNPFHLDQGSPLSPTSINFSYVHLINPSFLKLFQWRRQHWPCLFLLKTPKTAFFYRKPHNAWQRANILETRRASILLLLEKETRPSIVLLKYICKYRNIFKNMDVGRCWKSIFVSWNLYSAVQIQQFHILLPM